MYMHIYVYIIIYMHIYIYIHTYIHTCIVCHTHIKVCSHCMLFGMCRISKLYVLCCIPELMSKSA